MEVADVEGGEEKLDDGACDVLVAAAWGEERESR